LMPAYNAATYIGEAINSILHQTYTDFEFLIINDGSKDNSLEIINSFTDPRIRVINQPNKGLIDTLNEGMQLAKGRLIARFDADDVCLPERLQQQYDFLQQHPDYILVGSDVNYTDKDGNFLFRVNPVGYSNEEIIKNFYLKCPFLHPAVMFRKDVVINAGGYPANALTFEDYLLWRKLLGVGKMCNLDAVHVNMRLNPESVTIDEGWRGEEFKTIRRRCLENGIVNAEDALRLKNIIERQNFSSYKQASYYAMVGKKYLWENHNAQRARANLKQAIQLYPKNKELYMLWALSYLPAVWIKKIYSTVKSSTR
jgi:glycosyltransferase involved in cell wall biosynthesis